LLLILDLFRRFRYIRISPGQIDMLMVSLLKRRPRMRRYPMTRGTVVFLSEIFDRSAPRAANHPKPKVGQAILLRGSESDRMSFALSGKTDLDKSLFLTAILSSAPTPPLPDDALCG